MKIAVTYDDQDREVKVLFDLDKKGARQIQYEYDRKGWDAQSWAVVIDTEKQTYEEYWVEYDEAMD